MSEKRKHQRFIIEQAIEFDLKREHFFRAKGINVSEGGLLCETEYEATPLSKVEISFTLPRPNITIQTEGVIRHVKKKGKLFTVGISFVDFPEEYKNDLLKFLR